MKKYLVIFQRFTSKGCGLAVLVFLAMGSMNAMATDTDLLSHAQMEQRYVAFKAAQTKDSLPFTLLSFQKNKRLGASVTTYFPGLSFSLFSERLSIVSQWCEFIPLHLNIKACFYDMTESNNKLGFYLGVKSYITPERAELLLLDFEADVINDILSIKFTAKQGPFGSSNYDFQIRAIEADGGVYLEFDLSSEPGLVDSIAKLYLATVGRGKIGFSKEGKSWSGKPKFVRGTRGGSERNVVRYLLSIQAYFETIETESAEDGYRKRVERWFDLTQLHKKQLYELSRSDYIDIKLRERKNQIILLDAIRNNLTPVYQTEHHNP